jgi:hypothetical protein
MVDAKNCGQAFSLAKFFTLSTSKLKWQHSVAKFPVSKITNFLRGNLFFVWTVF